MHVDKRSKEISKGEVCIQRSNNAEGLSGSLDNEDHEQNFTNNGHQIVNNDISDTPLESLDHVSNSDASKPQCDDLPLNSESNVESVKNPPSKVKQLQFCSLIMINIAILFMSQLSDCITGIEAVHKIMNYSNNCLSMLQEISFCLASEITTTFTSYLNGLKFKVRLASGNHNSQINPPGFRNITNTSNTQTHLDCQTNSSSDTLNGADLMDTSPSNDTHPIAGETSPESTDEEIYTNSSLNDSNCLSKKATNISLVHNDGTGSGSGYSSMVFDIAILIYTLFTNSYRFFRGNSSNKWMCMRVTAIRLCFVLVFVQVCSTESDSNVYTSQDISANLTNYLFCGREKYSFSALNTCVRDKLFSTAHAKDSKEKNSTANLKPHPNMEMINLTESQDGHKPVFNPICKLDEEHLHSKEYAQCKIIIASVCCVRVRTCICLVPSTNEKYPPRIQEEKLQTPSYYHSDMVTDIVVTVILAGIIVGSVYGYPITVKMLITPIGLVFWIAVFSPKLFLYLLEAVYRWQSLWIRHRQPMNMLLLFCYTVVRIVVNSFARCASFFVRNRHSFYSVAKYIIYMSGLIAFMAYSMMFKTITSHKVVCFAIWVAWYAFSFLIYFHILILTLFAYIICFVLYTLVLQRNIRAEPVQAQEDDINQTENIQVDRESNEAEELVRRTNSRLCEDSGAVADHSIETNTLNSTSNVNHSQSDSAVGLNECNPSASTHEKHKLLNLPYNRLGIPYEESTSSKSSCTPSDEYKSTLSPPSQLGNESSHQTEDGTNPLPEDLGDETQEPINNNTRPYEIEIKYPNNAHPYLNIHFTAVCVERNVLDDDLIQIIMERVFLQPPSYPELPPHARIV